MSGKIMLSRVALSNQSNFRRQSLHRKGVVFKQTFLLIRDVGSLSTFGGGTTLRGHFLPLEIGGIF